MAVTFTSGEFTTGRTVKKIVGTWTCDSGGDATGTTTSYYDGQVLAMQCIPLLTPTASVPTNLYDVVVTDSDGHDVALAAGADSSNSGTEYKDESVLGAVSNSKLTFTVSNAGSLTGGVVVLWIR